MVSKYHLQGRILQKKKNESSKYILMEIKINVS